MARFDPNTALAQAILRKLEINGPDGRLVHDGLWGNNTAHALREFQKTHELEQTGKTDAATLAALQYELLEGGKILEPQAVLDDVNALVAKQPKPKEGREKKNKSSSSEGPRVPRRHFKEGEKIPDNWINAVEVFEKHVKREAISVHKDQPADNIKMLADIKRSVDFWNRKFGTDLKVEHALAIWGNESDMGSVTYRHSTSDEGAKGDFALMPKTFTMMKDLSNGFIGKDIDSRISNMRAGIGYLAYMTKETGDLEHALIKYSSRHYVLPKFLKTGRLNGETKGYVQQFWHYVDELKDHPEVRKLNGMQTAWTPVVPEMPVRDPRDIQPEPPQHARPDMPDGTGPVIRIGDDKGTLKQEIREAAAVLTAARDGDLTDVSDNDPPTVPERRAEGAKQTNVRSA